MHHDDFGGLRRDLLATRTAMRRRDALRLAFGASALTMLGCGGSGSDPDSEFGIGSCAKSPTETAGPFPGDGSNGPNVLNQSGVVRHDIRSSFGGLSGTAAGVPLTVHLRIQAPGSCANKAGAAVYVWHCDRAGLYSLYNAGVTNQNYLRGVQAANADGQVSFTTIFPGCYPGRWPHIHFEVFENVAAATSIANRIATSQLAFPSAACAAAYATAGYGASLTNFGGVSLQNDGVFGDDDGFRQLATVTGDAASGYTAALTFSL